MSAPLTAAVTGATGGLGQAVCERLAADGVRVAVIGRDDQRTAALADRLRAIDSCPGVHAATCDLASEDDIIRLVRHLIDAGFAPDVLVNNAATQGPIGPFLQADWRGWSATVAVDLLAPVLLTKLLAPGMQARGWGRVINISGGGATGPRPDFSAYAVAKTALVRFTETVAHELASSGVTVNAVAPGPMNTRMLDEVLAAGPSLASREYDPAVSRARDGGVPPEQAAALVAWLASSASDGVSGRLLSAVWDPWQRLAEHRDEIAGSDIYTLRRIVPKDRGKEWGVNGLKPEALNPEPLIAVPDARPLGVAIVGCGLIGRKRAAALPGGRLIACADLDITRAQALARTVDAGAKAPALQGTERTERRGDGSTERRGFSPGVTSPGVVAADRWQDVVTREDVDVVVVATTNEALASVTLGALDAGKHVLVEKPAARNVKEIDPLIASAKSRGLRVRVGFNHRYHPALLKAHGMVTSGMLGPLMFIRGRYGHGGRVGYDKEWRADPALSGGGELIDQGVHLIDLAGWFLGAFTSIEGFAATYFWKMPVDDNAFLTLRTADGQCAFLQVSCTEWKNLFSMEIYGRDGKIAIDGLGGSYGVERLTWYKMLPEMGPPETASWEFPRGDQSWALEFAAFVDDIRQGRESQPGLREARAALEVVEEIYRLSGADAGAEAPALHKKPGRSE